MATVMPGRLPTTNGTQWRSRASTSIPWLASMRSTCLIACLVTSPRVSAKPCPINATASEADSIAPSVAPASERMRLACRSPANMVRRKQWMFSNEICLLAGNARPSASEQEAWNRISAFLAMPFSRSSSSERQPSRFESFREVHPIRRILFLHPAPNRNEGSLEGRTGSADRAGGPTGSSRVALFVTATSSISEQPDGDTIGSDARCR